MTVTETIAQKGEYTVFTNGNDAIYLRGLGHVLFYFTRKDWDKFAEIIAYADLKIRGRIQ